MSLTETQIEEVRAAQQLKPQAAAVAKAFWTTHKELLKPTVSRKKLNSFRFARALPSLMTEMVETVEATTPGSEPEFAYNEILEAVVTAKNKQLQPLSADEQARLRFLLFGDLGDLPRC